MSTSWGPKLLNLMAQFIKHNTRFLPKRATPNCSHMQMKKPSWRKVLECSQNGIYRTRCTPKYSDVTFWVILFRQFCRSSASVEAQCTRHGEAQPTDSLPPGQRVYYEFSLYESNCRATHQPVNHLQPLCHIQNAEFCKISSGQKIWRN